MSEAMTRPGPMFFAAEIEAVQIGAGVAGGPVHGWMTRPRMARRPAWAPVEATETLRASDMGYRTAPGDALQAVYPPLMDRAFEVDRRIPLAPWETALAAAWGRMRWLNPAGAWDAMAATRSCDGRRVEIRWGRKAMDAMHMPIDPVHASLAIAFAGVAQSWSLSETALEVPLRDATYWLERPLQSALYTGSGGLEGPAGMAGEPKPKVRGGTLAAPVRDVPAILVDPVNRIYQWTDGPGQVVALYEGGDANIQPQGDVANLYSGSTSPGYYRTDNARGLIQLGSPAVRPITVDCIGHFPLAGAVTTAAAIARKLIVEDIGVEVQHLDDASFDAVDAAYPRASGWSWQGAVDAVEALSVILRGIGAKLIPTRDGRLRLVTLTALTGQESPVAAFGTSAVAGIVPLPLGQHLDPPAFRWRVGYQRRHADIDGSLSPAISDTRRQFLQAADRWGTWFDGDILAAYRRASDPPAIETGLLLKADADAMAAAFGALWGTRRRLYAATMPFAVAVQRDLGDVVRLTYPMDDLRNGRLGIVVGEQQRSSEASMTLFVMV